jgi:hypothetical protein
MPIKPIEPEGICADCDTYFPLKYMAAAHDNRGLLCRKCRQRNRDAAKRRAQQQLFGGQSELFGDSIPSNDRNGRAEFDALFR